MNVTDFTNMLLNGQILNTFEELKSNPSDELYAAFEANIGNVDRRCIENTISTYFSRSWLDCKFIHNKYIIKAAIDKRVYHWISGAFIKYPDILKTNENIQDYLYAIYTHIGDPGILVELKNLYNITEPSIDKRINESICNQLGYSISDSVVEYIRKTKEDIFKNYSVKQFIEGRLQCGDYRRVMVLMNNYKAEYDRLGISTCLE